MPAQQAQVRFVGESSLLAAADPARLPGAAFPELLAERRRRQAAAKAARVARHAYSIVASGAKVE